MSPSRGEPFWKALLGSDDLEMKSNLRRASIAPLAHLHMLVVAFGRDEHGRLRLPATLEFIEKLEELPTSIRAGRAELVADAMKHEEPRRGLPGTEWAVHHELYGPSKGEEEGGGQAGYSPKGLA